MRKEYEYILAGVVAGLLYFRRCPPRTPDGDGILSPSDGVVIGMEGQSALMFLSITDVHCQRAPTAATITDTTKDTMTFSDGMIVALRQGPMFRDFRLVIDVAPGQHVERGQKISHIWFGSHVRITLPAEKKFTIKLGDLVWGGQTVIAK